MAGNKDQYFNKAIKKTLCIDLKKWKRDRIYWEKTRYVYCDEAKSRQYVALKQEEIVNKINEIIPH